MAPLTPADVKRWDADAIHGVFRTATNRASTLQTLGDNLQQVHGKLSDWQGEAGDAFRADLGKARRDIEADGRESAQVAAAVSRAEADVRAVKAELDRIDQAAEADGFTVTSDWLIDSGTAKLDSAKSVAKQNLQGTLDACKLHAHSADQELAAAVRSAVGEAPVNGSAPAPMGEGQPKSLEDMLFPNGTGSGDAAKGPPTADGTPSEKAPSLEDMLLGRGTPAENKPSLHEMLLGQDQSGAVGMPAPKLKPAEVESFKAMARQTMINDGVPPDQIEARLDAAVANTQQWMDDGMPHYVPPDPGRPPPPGFAEGFADRWFSTEDALHDLTGQNGLDSMGNAWGGMAKGLAGKAEDYLTLGPVAPLKDAAHDFEHFLDNPAYYAGEKGADAAMTAPTLMFGGEGAALRAGVGEGLGEMTGLDAASGLAHDAPGVHPPVTSTEDAFVSPTADGAHGSIDRLPSAPLGDSGSSGWGQTSELGDHSQPGIGEGGEPGLVEQSDGLHGAEPYATDEDGHYVPGSLPSYEQLRGITETDPNTAYYWSGRNAEGIGVGPDDSGIAELIAHGSGGRTLEMTLADRGIDPLPVWNRHDPVSVQFWEDASASYAENAQGEVTAVIGSNLRPGNIWQSVEIPRLIENPAIDRITQIDPDTGLSTIIFQRGE